MTASKTSSKSTYASWLKYFNEGEGSRKRLVLEALLLYWFSWLVLSSGPEARLNIYVFPLAIHLTKGERLAIAPIYLGSLFSKLDECVANTASLVGQYYVVIHADTSFYKYLCGIDLVT